MDQYELIRTAHRVYGKSIRQIARETGHSRKTIRKALAGREPQYRRRRPRECPVMDPVAGIVERWLREDQKQPRKQRHTAHRIYARLVEEYGFGGAESTVRGWVRRRKNELGLGKAGKACVPLDPEAAREAEVDWGSAWVKMEGVERRVQLFCMRSRYSGKPFVRAYPWQRQEMLVDGHIRAFSYYRGVFPVLVYDNLKTAVKQILRGKARIEQDRFLSFRSYYTFEARFCNPARGEEKGGVEGLIGFARRNFLVPVPEVKDFPELNAWLEKRCQEYGARRIGGREDERTVEQRHQEESSRLLKLPDRLFENRKVLGVRIDPYQTANIDRNRYSVPRAYVGGRLWAHLECERVRIYSGGRQVAEHARIFGNSKWQIDPLHYLELIEERIGSFEAARAIRQWRPQWPPDYEQMLALLRQRRGDNGGTREFVRILQLHGSYPARAVEAAVGQALEYHTYSLEAVRSLLRRAQEESADWKALPAGLIPGITDRFIPPPALERYDELLGGRS